MKLINSIITLILLSLSTALALPATDAKSQKRHNYVVICSTFTSTCTDSPYYHYCTSNGQAEPNTRIGGRVHPPCLAACKCHNMSPRPRPVIYCIPPGLGFNVICNDTSFKDVKFVDSTFVFSNGTIVDDHVIDSNGTIVDGEAIDGEAVDGEAVDGS